MRIKLTITLLVLASPVFLSAQTADDYVSQGRSYLATTNVLAAHNSFSNAIRLSANHPTGNVLHAATRLLVLPNSPAGSNFLNRIGVPVAGRNIYDWTAVPPTDTNNVPLAPPGVNTGEGIAFLRTNVLAEVVAAEASLAKVTDNGFLLPLTSNETRTAAVTLDRGDVLMLRAGLKAVEYGILATHAGNFEVMLTFLRAVYDDHISIEQILAEHPQLFTIATTNDLSAARLAFQNAVDRYFEASAFIRSRPINVTRLFNHDAEQAEDEERFRVTLDELKDSLNDVVTLTVETNYSVFLGAHFSGIHQPRSFLPGFRGNGFVLGTLSDVTFGGLLHGLTDETVERFLADYVSPIPSLAPALSAANGQFQFPIHVAKGRGYVVQVSTNMQDWTDYTAFIAQDNSFPFADSKWAASDRRFYRVEDRTGNMPPPANDAFANRAFIPEMNFAMNSYTENASSEPGEGHWISGSGRSVWWVWTAPISGEVEVLTSGGDDCWPTSVFTGTSLAGLTRLAQGWNEVRFNAQAGVTYQIAVDTCWEDGGFQLIITRPPALLVETPVEGAVFSAPANVVVAGAASDVDGQIKQVEISGAFAHTTSAATFSVPWTNVPGGWYFLNIVATDDAGSEASEYRSFRVTPPNDDFMNATTIAGLPSDITGANAGAGKQPGEPNHAGISGGNSVWWQWTPAVSGSVSILCNITNSWGNSSAFLNVYTGGNVSNLTSVVGAAAYGDTARVNFTATAGQNYRIAVDSYDYGMIVMRLAARPPNDDFASRITISGANFNGSGNNVDASREPGEPFHWAATGGRSIWWSWQAPKSGTVAVATAGSSFDTILGVYTGSTLPTLGLVANNDDYNGSTSRVSFFAVAGTIYQIAVDGFAGASGSVALSVSQP